MLNMNDKQYLRIKKRILKVKCYLDVLEVWSPFHSFIFCDLLGKQQLSAFKAGWWTLSAITGDKFYLLYLVLKYLNCSLQLKVLNSN